MQLSHSSPGACSSACCAGSPAMEKKSTTRLGRILCDHSEAEVAAGRQHLSRKEHLPLQDPARCLPTHHCLCFSRSRGSSLCPVLSSMLD